MGWGALEGCSGLGRKEGCGKQRPTYSPALCLPGQGLSLQGTLETSEYPWEAICSALPLFHLPLIPTVPCWAPEKPILEAALLFFTMAGSVLGLNPMPRRCLALPFQVGTWGRG